nr:hypothetical protein [Tanacetum cinerariifolium]
MQGIAKVYGGGGRYKEPNGTGWWCRRWGRSGGEGKANVVADSLSRKERAKPRRVRAMSITIHSSITAKILEAQTHAMRYSVHPGADKMYYDLRGLYWWPGMKKDIAMYKALGTRLDLSTAYHPETDGQTLYGRRCRTPIAWTEVGEGKLLGPEIVQETTDKIVQIKERLKVARDRQKSYADKRPFKIAERIGPVAYRLCLPQELVGVHDTFHVSNLKKCLADVNFHVPLDEVKVDDKLQFVEEPIEILDRGVKKLKRGWIPIVKVRWNSRRGPKFTWEREDEMKRNEPKYAPHLPIYSIPYITRPHALPHRTSATATLLPPPLSPPPHHNRHHTIIITTAAIIHPHHRDSPTTDTNNTTMAVIVHLHRAPPFQPKGCV